MYERTSTIERQDSVANTGLVSGVLATDGEASDGHILNMSGGQMREGAPLLFNHDQWDGNLGSWVEFTQGAHELRGKAQIEMGGVGDKAAWRQDVAHMVSQGHIAAFSVRWDGIGEPVRRVNLSSDHPAFVDAETETEWSKLWGLYFDEWRLLEGSIVTLPADQAALIGRMRNGPGHWRQVLQRMAGFARDLEVPENDPGKMLEAFEQFALEELRPVQLADGRVFYVPDSLQLREEQEEEPEEISEEPVMEESEEEAAEMAVEEEPTETEEPRTLDRDTMIEMMREEILGAYTDSREEYQAILEVFRTEFRSMYAEFREDSKDLLYQALGMVR